jgi:hypothetical protein
MPRSLTIGLVIGLENAYLVWRNLARYSAFEPTSTAVNFEAETESTLKQLYAQLIANVTQTQVYAESSENDVALRSFGNRAKLIQIYRSRNKAH